MTYNSTVAPVANVIVKGIPIPRPAKRWDFDNAELGDSVLFFNIKEANSFASLLRKHADDHNLPWGALTVKNADDGVKQEHWRVWIDHRKKRTSKKGGYETIEQPNYVPPEKNAPIEDDMIMQIDRKTGQIKLVKNEPAAPPDDFSMFGDPDMHNPGQPITTEQRSNRRDQSRINALMDAIKTPTEDQPTPALDNYLLAEAQDLAAEEQEFDQFVQAGAKIPTENAADG